MLKKKLLLLKIVLSNEQTFLRHSSSRQTSPSTVAERTGTYRRQPQSLYSHLVASSRAVHRAYPLRAILGSPTATSIPHAKAGMSFSSLVQDLSLHDSGVAPPRRPRAEVSSSSTIDERTSTVSRAMSYASTAATTVSISGDISSQLHGGYYHPLARSWQAERQLTKVCHDKPCSHVSHVAVC
jgi:hypothetical protein